jgi:hypothetical protein
MDGFSCAGSKDGGMNGIFQNMKSRCEVQGVRKILVAVLEEETVKI